MTTRDEIYAAIVRERAYQDAKYGTLEERQLSIPAYLRIANRELKEAGSALIDDDDEQAALCEALQAMTVLFAMFERHGVVERMEATNGHK